MIDKVIRFVWIDKNKDHKEAVIPYEYQICIMSAKVMNPDYRVVVHSNVPLKYESLMVNGKTLIENEIIEQRLLDEAYGCGIGKVVAHISDYVRYSILYEQGGFYADTDVFFIKSLDDLLCNRAVLAREKPTTVCCAAFGFEKNHDLIKIVLDEYHNNYIENEWLYNSQLVLKNGAKRFKNSDVNILKYENGFFYPNWKFYPMCMFYDEIEIHSKDDIGKKFHGYTHHMWSSTSTGERLRRYIKDNLENVNDHSYIVELFRFYRREYIKMIVKGR